MDLEETMKELSCWSAIQIGAEADAERDSVIQFEHCLYLLFILNNNNNNNDNNNNNNNSNNEKLLFSK